MNTQQMENAGSDAINRSLSILQEVYDNIQILCNTCVDGVTVVKSGGSGSLFARVEHCRTFIRNAEVDIDNALNKDIDEID